MNEALGIFGVVTGIAGIALTIYYARKAERLNKMRKRLEWADIQTAASDLGQQIKRDISPVAVVTPGLPGATFANLISSDFAMQPPVYVGNRTWKDDPHNFVPTADSFVFDTKKWIVTIPKAVTRHENGVILIIDDFVMSGDFLDSLCSTLVQAGVPRERIRSAAITVTKVAIKNHKAPDYYWWIADNDEFFFPWGKAR
ncbi:hypothetical protein GT755_23265 [Herbidospora sp. NEAU-GS84]|uniref:Phosphoribosyltransferase domain-containing protein n=1 Tax=Herbidospora solisilvae TaxID=2696284 RepID=A0A7C9P1E5_9ACTN|nr:hypothetical protein [Herbidospora solisilvae]NAS24597.1 hypothetical protein [Herbidospora solisilvae]